MPQFDSSFYASQIFWMCLSFGLLFWAMHTRLMPKIRRVQQQRADEKEAVLKQALALMDQSYAVEQALELCKKQAEQECSDVVAKALEVREKRMQEAVYTHQASYHAQITELTQRMEHEYTLAWQTLCREVPDLCSSLTKKWSDKTLEQEGSVL